MHIVAAASILASRVSKLIFKGKRKEVKTRVCVGDSRLKELESEEIPVLFYTPVLFHTRTSQRLPTRLKLKNVKNNKE